MLQESTAHSSAMSLMKPLIRDGPAGGIHTNSLCRSDDNSTATSADLPSVIRVGSMIAHMFLEGVSQPGRGEPERLEQT